MSISKNNIKKNGYLKFISGIFNNVTTISKSFSSMFIEGININKNSKSIYNNYNNYNFLKVEIEIDF